MRRYFSASAEYARSLENPEFLEAVKVRLLQNLISNIGKLPEAFVTVGNGPNQVLHLRVAVEIFNPEDTDFENTSNPTLPSIADTATGAGD